MLEFHFRDQESLVLGLHIGGVARGIDQPGQDQLAIRSAESRRIPQLDRGPCPRKK